ncbi:hypothetical protein IU487_34825 [Nocardia puris]|nr:hypothetical protein [Nocardia puris]
MISSYVGDDPVSSWDEEVLHLVASGLLQLAEQVGADGAVSVPYPASLQRALNRLAVMGVARGVDAPGSVAEVLQLAHRSLSEWPLRLPREVFDDGDVLLASGTPTRLCGE